MLPGPAAEASLTAVGVAGGLAPKNEVMACWLRSGALLARIPPPFSPAAFFGVGGLAAGLPPVEPAFLLLLAGLVAGGSALLALLFGPTQTRTKAHCCSAS